MSLSPRIRTRFENGPTWVSLWTVLLFFMQLLIFIENHIFLLALLSLFSCDYIFIRLPKLENLMIFDLTPKDNVFNNQWYVKSQTKWGQIRPKHYEQWAWYSDNKHAYLEIFKYIEYNEFVKVNWKMWICEQIWKIII